MMGMRGTTGLTGERSVARSRLAVAQELIRLRQVAGQVNGARLNLFSPASISTCSRNERIQRSIAKDPKEQDYSEKGPDEFCWDEKLCRRPACNRRAGRAEKDKEQKRQRDKEQRVKFEGGERMAMQQLVQAT